MCKTRFKIIIATFIVFSLNPGSLGANVEMGMDLHQTNCLSCHGTEAYTRSDRRVTSFPSLITRVNACNVNLGMGWFDDEVDAVARYLDENYYKF
jgi:hypothetical protein